MFHDYSSVTNEPASEISVFTSFLTQIDNTLTQSLAESHRNRKKIDSDTKSILKQFRNDYYSARNKHNYLKKLMRMNENNQLPSNFKNYNLKVQLPRSIPHDEQESFDAFLHEQSCNYKRIILKKHQEVLTEDFQRASEVVSAYLNQQQFLQKFSQVFSSWKLPRITSQLITESIFNEVQSLHNTLLKRDLQLEKEREEADSQMREETAVPTDYKTLLKLLRQDLFRDPISQKNFTRRGFKSRSQRRSKSTQKARSRSHDPREQRPNSRNRKNVSCPRKRAPNLVEQHFPTNFRRGRSPQRKRSHSRNKSRSPSSKKSSRLPQSPRHRRGRSRSTSRKEHFSTRNRKKQESDRGNQRRKKF